MMRSFPSYHGTPPTNFRDALVWITISKQILSHAQALGGLGKEGRDLRRK
jgi:hypothetical protein